MTRQLFLEDSYLRQCKSIITSVKDGKFIVLDKTIFYPKGGGQPHDTGIIKMNDIDYKVIYVGKFSGEISHEVNERGLKKGDPVQCLLDWKRRYKLMRSHTAAHVFASLLYEDTKALVTGNQIKEEKIRFDFNLKNYNKEILYQNINKANELFQKDIPVKSYTLPREEALKIPNVIKMAKALPPKISSLRIVEIVGIDKQADGGTHVNNLKEVGKITLLKTENKGKNNRRVYFKLT